MRPPAIALCEVATEDQQGHSHSPVKQATALFGLEGSMRLSTRLIYFSVVAATAVLVPPAPAPAQQPSAGLNVLSIPNEVEVRHLDR